MGPDRSGLSDQLSSVDLPPSQPARSVTAVERSLRENAEPAMARELLMSTGASR
jgi:hypothetical protein